ncbi:MAG: cation:proton antiporter [Bdellovibrionales bacterium]|nr:cation:proton antiporter [Bdellovibrionales bacterium]
MIHLPHLISDLGVILVTAAIVTILFRKMKQPVVLGYIIAGFLVGPGFPFLPTVKEPESIRVWAEIGVIFLLFGLGLEFSFKKLARVGKSASITALFEITSMMGLGFLAGLALGWSKMDALFLGGMVSISSTSIIMRAFDELSLKGQRFSSLVFGVLIFEDLVAILILVLLSTVAVTQTLSGAELLGSSLKLAFFLLLWFLVGIYLLPPFLNRIRNVLTDETAVVVAIGLCLLMVMIATGVGFSPALGAFVMGSLIAETREAKRIDHLLHPVRDLFAAVFFVSVGMLLKPDVLVTYWFEILFLSIVIILGKLTSATIGALVAGRPLRESVHVGVSLTQIGEFSFIIATLGLTLKVTSDFLYPIAVAVSILTSFTTPYLLKFAGPICDNLEKVLPKTATQMLERYQLAANQEQTESHLGILIWKSFGARLLFGSILTIAVGLAFDHFVLPFAEGMFGPSVWLSAGLTVFGLTLAAPFLWAVVFGGSSDSLKDHELSRLTRLKPGFLLARSLLAFLLVTFLMNVFDPGSSILGALAGLVTIGFLLTAKFAAPIYKSIEKRFVQNLESSEYTPTPKHRPLLAPWDATLSEIVISPDSEIVGQTLMNSGLKDRYGIMVSLIERGSKRVLAPTRDFVLMPYDRLFVIGLDSQISLARKAIEEHSDAPLDLSVAAFGLVPLFIHPTNDALSRYVGRTLRDCGLREDVEGIVVGIERDGTRTLNPDSSWIIGEGDLIWMVADIVKVKALGKDHFVPGANATPV